LREQKRWLKIGEKEGWLEIDKQATDTMGNLYSSYKDFCEGEGRKALPKNLFSMKLREHGFRGKRIRGHLYFEGIRAHEKGSEEVQKELWELY